MTEPQTSNMEQDMRHVFDNALQAISSLRDKTISAVISHSHQAREISELRQQVTDLSQRMSSVIQEAQKVREDLHLVISERDKYKKDAEDNHNLAVTYEGERDEARRRLDDANQALARLETEASAAELAKRQSDALIDRLRGDVSYYQDAHRRVQELNADIINERNKAQEELKQAQDKLTRLQGVVRELFPATEPVKSETPFSGSAAVENLVSPSSYPPVQQAGEGQATETLQPVNERIDGQDLKPEETHKPWWDKKAAE